MEYCKFKQKISGRGIPGGFTLIELLVAILIFSVIAVSIYSVFNTGVFVWRRLGAATDTCQNLKVTLELMGREIANYIPSEKIMLEGDGGKISFLGRLDDEGNLGKVTFFLEGSTNTLMRSQQDLKSVLNQAAESAAEGFSPDISALRFMYYCRKADKEDEYEWIDALDPKLEPVCAAVSIFVAQAGANFTKMVHLYVKGKNE